MIDSFHNVLFLGAHPDDEIACSGTIARLAGEGAIVDVMTFSTCADLIPEGFTPEDLIDEWHQATDLLGVRARSMGDLPNRFLPEWRQDILDELILRRDHYDYDLVLLPATSDIHQDHATVREEGIRAFKHTTILGYEHPQNSVRAATFNCFVALDEPHLAIKYDHAALYHSQAKRTYMHPDFIRGVAAMRGVQANVNAAEAFEVIRWVM